VHAEGAALADEAVEQERGFLCELVILDEELLELVDDERMRGIGAAGAADLAVLRR